MKPRISAVFIEPQGTLRTALLEAKALLESRRPGEAYTLHPPHCTIIAGDYGDPAAWLPDLRARVARRPAFTLPVDGWIQFPDDELAGGGHTVAFRAGPTPALLQLQADVAEVLAPFSRLAPASHPLIGREPFATSLRRFGFPFVGPHWIPHFTIGSPRVAASDPLLRALTAGPPCHSTPVADLSVWNVDDEVHERLHELALAPRPSGDSPNAPAS